jgi:BolA protein
MTAPSRALPPEVVLETLRQRLVAALAPASIEIVDDSARHAAHPGAAGGGRHLLLTIVSERFSGQRTLARQRLVIDAAGDLLAGPIHALGITAKAPEEV